MVWPRTTATRAHTARRHARPGPRAHRLPQRATVTPTTHTTTPPAGPPPTHSAPSCAAHATHPLDLPALPAGDLKTIHPIVIRGDARAAVAGRSAWTLTGLALASWS